MLKREIQYEDFNGNKTSDVFYFNISKTELVELEVEYKNGFGAMLQSLIETKDSKLLIKKFQELILMAYGEKSEDGKRFIKNDELREQFKQSAAFDSLFMEMSTDDNAAAVFLIGIMPSDLAKNLDPEEIRKQMTSGGELPQNTPPTPPSS